MIKLLKRSKVMHTKEVKGILSSSNGMNLYRGCQHGCIYCDSRSTCYQFDHEFEDIEVKSNAIELLENTLKHKRKRCMIGTGAMCDPYMPLEKEMQLTRKSLEVIERYDFGIALQTKSDLVLRDLDLLRKINQKTKAVVQITLTTYDEELCKLIEPAVCTTKRRFEVLKILQENNIPTVVWLSPILPFINDTKENIEGILSYCIDAGVKGILCFGMGVTLREGDREYFYRALDKYFPGMKQKYIKAFGNAYEIASPNNNELMSIYKRICKEHNIMSRPDEVFKYLRQFEEKGNTQMNLFDFST